MIFTRRKFLSLSREQQHRHISNLLRKLHSSPHDVSLVEQYQTLCEWIAHPVSALPTPQEICQAYHEHLNLAQRTHKEHNLLPSIEIGDRTSPLAPPLPVTILLDNLRSAHNVGSIFRTVEAFQLGPILLRGSTPGQENPKVQKTAMGAADWISARPIADITEIPRPMILLETAESAQCYSTFPFPDQFTLCVGNEELGCSDELIASADAFIRIPMYGRKNSLNVANSFAIVAAAIRQKRGTP